MNRGQPHWLVPLCAVVAVQAIATCLYRIVPTLAPALTAPAGWHASTAGLLAGLMTVGCVLFLLVASPMIRQEGAFRVLQLGLASSAVGAVLCAWPTGMSLLLGCVLLGIGYGPSTSAASDVLQRHSPHRHRNLAYSIKQAGVPVGGVIAGLALPPLAIHIGMAGVATVMAGVAMLAFLALEPIRRRLDPPAAGLGNLQSREFGSWRNMQGPLRLLKQSPQLRLLGLAGGALALGQGVWFAYLVTFAVVELDWSIAAAGALFAVMQGASIIGRPLLGWLSDQLGSATSILRGCAVASAATTALLAAVPTDAPMLLWSISIAGGLTVSSWNGVHMARIAEAVPADLVADGASATNLIVFAGYIVGPALVMAVVELGGGYRAAMFAMAAVTTAALIPLRNVREPQTRLGEAVIGPRPPR